MGVCKNCAVQEEYDERHRKTQKKKSDNVTGRFDDRHWHHSRRTHTRADSKAEDQWIKKNQTQKTDGSD